MWWLSTFLLGLLVCTLVLCTIVGQLFSWNAETKDDIFAALFALSAHLYLLAFSVVTWYFTLNVVIAVSWRLSKAVIRSLCLDGYKLSSKPSYFLKSDLIKNLRMVSCSFNKAVLVGCRFLSSLFILYILNILVIGFAFILELIVQFLLSGCLTGWVRG